MLEIHFFFYILFIFRAIISFHFKANETCKMCFFFIFISFSFYHVWKYVSRFKKRRIHNFTYTFDVWTIVLFHRNTISKEIFAEMEILSHCSILLRIIEFPVLDMSFHTWMDREKMFPGSRESVNKTRENAKILEHITREIRTWVISRNYISLLYALLLFTEQLYLYNLHNSVVN